MQLTTQLASAVIGAASLIGGVDQAANAQSLSFGIQPDVIQPRVVPVQLHRDYYVTDDDHFEDARVRLRRRHYYTQEPVRLRRRRRVYIEEPVRIHRRSASFPGFSFSIDL